VSVGWALVFAFGSVGLTAYLLVRNEWTYRLRTAWLDAARDYLLARVEGRDYADDPAAYFDALQPYHRMFWGRPWHWRVEQYVRDPLRYEQVRQWQAWGDRPSRLH